MWKWHKERANLGTRFNWLQSQISDLDLKIRQQIDVCAQVCALKVPLEFAPAAAIDDDDDACTSTAARIRPLIFVSNRKLVRTAGTFKYVQLLLGCYSNELIVCCRWNNKMRQLSTIHCGCSPPFSACILCTGRTNNVDTPVDVCTGNIRELYAPLDPGVHSMLTLPSGII
jgi:KAT8 regulatory NSL complex subunit 1